MFLQISKLWIIKTSKSEEKKTRNLQFTRTHFDDSQLGKIFANAKDVEEFSAQVSSIFLWLLEPPTDWHPATGAASARHTHSCSTCNIFVKIANCISSNRKMYFSKSQNVFLQIATHLFVIFLNVFVHRLALCDRYTALRDITYSLKVCTVGPRIGGRTQQNFNQKKQRTERGFEH